ncbi:MAG: carboxypeptidase-like regulatory domain-containing protein [Acidobacteriota bacterium]
MSDLDHQPVSGAQVLVVSGSHAGADAVTDAAGAFSLPGGFIGPLVLSATASGSKTSTQGMSLQCGSCGDTALLNFFLIPDVAPFRFEAGEYDMTVSIDAACTGIPLALRTRNYTATIAQPSTDTSYPISISGDYLRRRIFDFYVWGDHVGIDSEQPTLREELPDRTYLFWNGDGGTKVDTSVPLVSLSMPFQGAFDYCVLKSPLDPTGNCSTAPADQVVVRARCMSPNQDRLVLKRR